MAGLGAKDILRNVTALEQLIEEINFQRAKEMRQCLMSKDSDSFVIVHGTTYWTDLFVRHFLFQTDRSTDADDLLFFIRKKQVRGSKYIPRYQTEVEVYRKDSRKLPIGDPDIDWEETVYLNIIVHQFDYTLTLAVCTRTSPKELQVLKRHSQKVYASPSRRRMDTKGEVEEITYPNVCFHVDNFDEVFSDMLVRDGEMVCVELVAADHGGSRQAVIFLGSIRYDALKRVYDTRGSLSSKMAQRMMLGLFNGGSQRIEFVKMKGPQGKGHAEMAVSKPKGSGVETPTSEPGVSLTDLWDSDWEDDPEDRYMYSHQRRLSDPSANLNSFVNSGWVSKAEAKSRSENEGLDHFANGLYEIQSGDVRDAVCVCTCCSMVTFRSSDEVDSNTVNNDLCSTCEHFHGHQSVTVHSDCIGIHSHGLKEKGEGQTITDFNIKEKCNTSVKFNEKCDRIGSCSDKIVEISSGQEIHDHVIDAGVGESSAQRHLDYKMDPEVVNVSGLVRMSEDGCGGSLSSAESDTFVVISKNLDILNYESYDLSEIPKCSPKYSLENNMKDKINTESCDPIPKSPVKFSGEKYSNLTQKNEMPPSFCVSKGHKCSDFVHGKGTSPRIEKSHSTRKFSKFPNSRFSFYQSRRVPGSAVRVNSLPDFTSCTNQISKHEYIPLSQTEDNVYSPKAYCTDGETVSPTPLRRKSAREEYNCEHCKLNAIKKLYGKAHPPPIYYKALSLNPKKLIQYWKNETTTSFSKEDAFPGSVSDIISVQPSTERTIVRPPSARPIALTSKDESDYTHGLLTETLLDPSLLTEFISAHPSSEKTVGQVPVSQKPSEQHMCGTCQQGHLPEKTDHRFAERISRKANFSGGSVAHNLSKTKPEKHYSGRITKEHSLLKRISGDPLSGTSEYPLSGTSERPLPRASEHPLPRTSEYPSSITSEYPSSRASEYPLSGTSEHHLSRRTFEQTDLSEKVDVQLFSYPKIYTLPPSEPSVQSKFEPTIRSISEPSAHSTFSEPHAPYRFELSAQSTSHQCDPSTSDPTTCDPSTSDPSAQTKFELANIQSTLPESSVLPNSKLSAASTYGPSVLLTPEPADPSKFEPRLHSTVQVTFFHSESESSGPLAFESSVPLTPESSASFHGLSTESGIRDPNHLKTCPMNSKSHFKTCPLNSKSHFKTCLTNSKSHFKTCPTNSKSLDDILSLKEKPLLTLPFRITPDGTRVSFPCDLKLDDGAYNPLWATKGFTQTFHFWKESRRAQSVPFNAYLTYVTLPWFTIITDILDHQTGPILTF